MLLEGITAHFAGVVSSGTSSSRLAHQPPCVAMLVTPWTAVSPSDRCKKLVGCHAHNYQHLLHRKARASEVARGVHTFMLQPSRKMPVQLLRCWCVPCRRGRWCFMQSSHMSSSASATSASSLRSWPALMALKGEQLLFTAGKKAVAGQMPSQVWASPVMLLF